MIKKLIHFLSVIGLHLILSSASSNAVDFPPGYGLKTAENRYLPSLKLIYYNDFESQGDLFDLGTDAAVYTKNPALVMSGSRSVRLPAPSTFEIPVSEVSFEGGATYMIELDYQLDDASSVGTNFFVGFTWEGATDLLGGLFRGRYPAVGTFRHNMRLPPGEERARVKMGVTVAGAVVDRIRIYQLVSEVYPPTPNMLKLGFPRLSNYHVYSSSVSALINEEDVEKIRDHLSRYHMVNGGGVDHSFGDELDYLYLKERNPDIILLPYHQTFLSVLQQSEPLGGGAGILRFFNDGLEDPWFLKAPDGERLNELLYPLNFQMNATSFCPEVEGYTFVDYSHRYLQETVLATGYWEGIHFDQAEWYPNPLLGNGDPFNSTIEIFVPIDLDNDGVEETKAELYVASLEGFMDYFDQLDQRLGPGVLFFGNAGEMSKQEEVLKRMNGFQFEYFSPFRRNESGAYDMGEPNYWYRYIDVHNTARGLLRAPQVPSTQMTGVGLGIPVGEPTGNGVMSREPVLVAEDFERMRFGLASALMTDGFFGYDFIDNTTLPFAWLDEYAVDLSTGKPSEEIEHTQYLGQPLGDAVELDYEKTVLLDIDFEGGLPSLPEGVYLSAGASVTNDSAFVLSGSKSGVFSFTAEEGNPSLSDVFLFTDPALYPLEEGSTYQLFFDYLVADYQPVHYQSLLSVGVVDLNELGTLDRFNFLSIWSRDVNRGQSGTLRAANKVTSSSFTVLGVITESAVLVVDNIKLIKGLGGVFRRDFENGVVLVNPTSEAQMVSYADISGPLSRSGLNRIDGSQVPGWNNGAAVAEGIEIPPLDGIILLADNIVAPLPGIPGSLETVVENGGVTVSWVAPGGTVSGYAINYGLSGGDLPYYEMVGLREDNPIGGLEAGRTYSFRIAAYDYLGNLSAYTSVVEQVVAGAVPSVIPTFAVPSALVRDGQVTMTGSDLAGGSAVYSEGNYPFESGGMQVFVNGVAAPLVSVSPGEVQFRVMGNLGGDRALLRVVRDGVSSISSFVDLVDVVTAPEVLHWERGSVDSFVLGWRSKPNTVYQVEESTDLLEWTPLGEAKSALSGYTEEAFDLGPATEEQAWFFRIIRVKTEE